MLIIYLPTHAPTHYDHVVSTDGVCVDSYGQCEASQLPQDPGERVGVVPWHMLSWHKVTVPPSVGSRKTLVLNSLLEDNLLQEPQAVHLAVAPGATGILRRGGELLVAACDKQWLVQTLERLQQHGCTLQRLVPELHPLAAQQTPRLHLIPHEGQTQALVCTHDSVWPLPLMAASTLGKHTQVQQQAGQVQIQFKDVEPQQLAEFLSQAHQQSRARVVQANWQSTRGLWSGQIQFALPGAP